MNEEEEERDRAYLSGIIGVAAERIEISLDEYGRVLTAQEQAVARKLVGDIQLLSDALCPNVALTIEE